MTILFILLALLFGYALGSIPFGLLLTRLAGLGDIRAIGSGNIGATNVLRTGNKALALATLLLDAGKGFAAVLLAGLVFADPLAPLAAGVGAFVGHIAPVWLKFKGGKGVAVYIGILWGLAPLLGAIFCALWLAFAFFTRMSSAGALGASGLIHLVAFFTHSTTLAVTCLILSALLWYKHHENIKRLLAGEEPKIGKKKRIDDPAAPNSESQ